MKTYKFDNTSITARNTRTAQRRYVGFKRGELTIEGKTILAKDRKPKGHSMRKKPCGSSN